MNGLRVIAVPMKAKSYPNMNAPIDDTIARM